MFRNKVIMVSGGSGTIGQAIIKRLLPLNPKKVIVYSRSEFLQYTMRNDFKNIKNSDRIRYLIGDVRDLQRLNEACKDVDYIIHTAALKQVDTLEYNPAEAVKTNILGGLNVIQAAIENKVKKVIALSTDKGVQPLNLYGATKLCSDKLFINGNAMSGNKTLFSVVRYGNVAESRGSVIPFFQALLDDGERILPLTDERMTRFHITKDQAINLIFTAFKEMAGGEIYVAKIPSFKIIDLIKSMGCTPKVIGKRPGEKIHEIMITQDDAQRTYENKDYYIIYPEYDWIENRKFKGKKVKEGFNYSSDINEKWLYK